MKKALKQLIDALDEIFAHHEEVGDAAVREIIATVRSLNAGGEPMRGLQLAARLV